MPSGQASRQRVTDILSKYIGQSKVNYNKEHQSLLETFGANVRASRSRTGRPEIYDKLASRKFWESTRSAEMYARYIFQKNVEYYESPRIQRIIKEWKELNPNVSIPIEVGGDYYFLKEYLNTKMPSSVMRADAEKSFRRWFSRKVSEQEFEQRIKNEKDEREFVNHLYKQSEYKGKMSFEDYEQTFYSVMREAMSKSKSQYSSDTIRTAILDNGIDDAIEEGGINQNVVDNLNKLIEEKFADIQELNARLFGNLEKTSKISSDRKAKISKISGERRALMNDNTIDWYNTLTEDEREKVVLGNYEDKRDISDISRLFPTMGELKKANSIMQKARRQSSHKRIPYDLRTYKMLDEIMKQHPNITDEYELSKNLFDVWSSMNFAEVYELVKGSK